MLCAGLTLALLQTAPAPSPELDFWVGDWNLTAKSRTAPGKDEWQSFSGRNRIKKTQKGQVVHENFTSSQFDGESWSVWNPRKKQWSQTWVDDQGSYLLFEGGKVGDNFVLTQTNIPAAAKFSMRMVFSNITKKSFHWEWQRQAEGATTWENMMEIDYTRRK